MVGTFARIIDPSDKETGTTITAPTDHKDIKRVILRYNPFVHSSILYKGEALEEAGPYTNKFIPGFEWEIYANIMSSWEVANIPQFLVSYRIHPKSLTRSRKPLKRFLGTTKARWYVFKKLKLPLWHTPLSNKIEHPML